MRKADLGQAYAGALSRGGLQVLARPGAEGVNPPTLRHHGNLAVFPRVRAGDSTLPFAVRLMSICAPPNAASKSIDLHHTESAGGPLVTIRPGVIGFVSRYPNKSAWEPVLIR